MFLWDNGARDFDFPSGEVERAILISNEGASFSGLYPRS